MSETIEIQSVARSALDQSRLCSFNHEVIDAPTAPLIHQEARFPSRSRTAPIPSGQTR